MLSLALTLVLTSWTCEQEDTRVRAHLEDAYTQLTTAAPQGLTPSQWSGRAAALRRLRAYIDAGRFPRNQSHRAATPVFVDAVDTHCAMGQLLSELGGDDVVQHVRRTRNLETVPTLADEPGLAEWLRAHGLTAEEAALVQPTYYRCEPIVPCGGDGSYDAVLEPVDGGQYWAGRTTRVVRPGGLCVGERGPWLFEPQYMVWPSDGVLSMPEYIADDGAGWVSWMDAHCAERPHLAEVERGIDDFRECVRTIAQRDLRWLAVTCFNTGWTGPERERCGTDGRYRSARLPPRGTMRAELMTFFARVGIDAADAGIDLATYEALEQRMWDLSDDGGLPLDAGITPVRTWDGGAIVVDQACIDARDAGVPDAGASDAGLLDAGVIDAGEPDAGLFDAGTPDAGTADAGHGDAGMKDDAGMTSTNDAGSVDEPPMQSGCGCSGVDALAAALVLVLLRKRR